MSLDFSLVKKAPTEVFTANITHNLATMAEEAGIKEFLWDADRLESAEELIKPLEEGLRRLKKDPKKYQEFNPKNGWGDYHELMSFVTMVIEACKEDPDATPETCK